MRILTWNINGVRATKAPLKQVLDSLDADIVCLQETKVTRDQLDEASAIVEGYSSYFSFSKARSGYSGVATYCKDGATPIKAEEGLTGLLANQKEGDIIGCYGDQTMFTEDELRSLDKEGRAVITQHTIRDTNGKERLLAVINVYCPRADPEKEERKDFKLRFYRLLQTRAQALLQAGSHVIVLGDVNTSHRPIDHCDPNDVEYFSENPGRKWLDQFLYDPHQSGDTLISQSNHSINPNNQSDAASDQLNTSLDSSIQAENASEKVPGGYFVDTFRFFHPTQRSAFTCWCTVTGARQTNYGTRIDYILSSRDLLSQFTDCTIMPEVEGSDHCPVRGELACTIVTASKCPALCSKYMPEFAGKQQKLSVFFTKVKKGEMGEEKSSQDSVSSSQGSDGQSDICSQQSSSQPWENCSSESEGSGGVTKQGQGQSRISMKRTASDPVASRSVKKQKTEQVKTRKQGTLMSFFGKKTKTETVDRRKANSSDVSQENSEVEVEKDVVRENVVSNRSISSSNTSVDVDDSKRNESKDAEYDRDTAETKPKQNQASFWKTVLKGPPPPPPCKGHKEPCVLRTVKKQGPNFGKQFYVCARPQGHSSNHAARCDHFQWVSRGKDK